MSTKPAHPVTKRAARKTLRDRIPKGARQVFLIFTMLLVLEYLVVPRFIVARQDLHMLSHLNPAWIVGGVLLEAASLFAYSLLTWVLLPEGGPGISKLWRIDLAGLAIAHVVPGGTAGSATLGYRLLTGNGVSGRDAGFAMATQGMGSAVVLNVILWTALVVSIPFAGLHRAYVLAALVGMLLLLAFAALVFLFTEGEEIAVRLLRTIGRHLPIVTADQLENLVRHVAQALRDLASNPARLRRALIWAAANWLLDAAALWCFLAALDIYVNPVYLFVAYGVGNVLAAIPITPAGLGLVETAVPLLLKSFGYSGNLAVLAVIGWRFVNFWAPIPVGGGAYLSLKIQSGAFSGVRHVVGEMTAESRNRSVDFAEVAASNAPAHREESGQGAPDAPAPGRPDEGAGSAAAPPADQVGEESSGADPPDAGQE